MSSGKWNSGEDRKEQQLLQKADKQEELRIKKEFLATQRKQEQEQEHKARLELREAYERELKGKRDAEDQARKAAVAEKAEKRLAFLENQRIKAQQLKEQREREKVEIQARLEESKAQRMAEEAERMDKVARLRQSLDEQKKRRSLGTTPRKQESSI